MKEQFTPGEWIAYIDGSDDSDFTKYDAVIIGMATYNDDPCNHYCNHKVVIDGVEATDFEGIANAHLIAAAPKMYRLLQKFLPCDEDGNGIGDFLYSDGSEFMGEEVIALMAEARGENKDSE